MTPSLPIERYGAFLWVRRGLPLLGMGLALVASKLDGTRAGWWLLAAAACLSMAWPTFQSGEGYLRHRASIVRWDGYLVYLFRPMARLLGREEAWILSYCSWNNHRVRQVFEHRKAQRSLVLLPHCIQLSRCKAEIFQDLKNCYECNLCPVEDVLHGTLQLRWEARITNRSYKAYREAWEYRPDLIVAVSCTDRLLKGLMKISDIPAYVVPLSLPHGMCVDTQFNVPHLLSAMDNLAELKRESKIQPLHVSA